MTAVGRFFYESLTLNLAGTFFTDRKSGGGRCAEATVIRGFTVQEILLVVIEPGVTGLKTTRFLYLLDLFGGKEREKG